MRATSLKFARSQTQRVCYKYLIIYVILIIVSIIMAPESVPTTLRAVMASTCEISRDAVLIAERWLAVRQAGARYQSEQYLRINITSELVEAKNREFNACLLKKTIRFY